MTENKDKILVEKILNRQHQLEEIRANYEPVWNDVASFGCSRHPDFQKKQQEGKKRKTEIYDGTPESALKLWVDGIQGYHISRALEWFNYRIGGQQFRFLNEDKDIRQWLQDTREAVYWEFNESNFYDGVREFLLDGGSVGNANIFVDEDVGNREITFLVHNPRQIWFAENYLGEVDVVHRKFELDARQAIQDFGEDKVSDNIKNAYKTGRLDNKFEFLQAIYPIDDYIVTEYDSKSKGQKKFKKYVSYYVEADKKILVRRGGFRVLNPIIWRMQKYSGEIYGRGLLGDAIVEIKRLNSASKTMMEVSQLSVEPPLNIPQEMRDEVDMTPHGMNYYRDAGRIISPINVGVNYPVGKDYTEMLQKAIETHFQVDFFLMLARMEGTKTATEIIELAGEKVALMSSLFGQLNKSMNRVHDRVLNLLFMQRKLPEIPPILLAITGGFFNIDVEYVGPLAEAQKRLFKARGIRQSLEVAAPYIQMFPGILDRIDDDELAKELLTTHGMPAKIFREDEEVAMIKQQRAQQQQQMFQAELAEKTAKVVQKLGKEVEKESVIDKLEKGE